MVIAVGHSVLGAIKGAEHWAGWAAGELQGGLGAAKPVYSELSFWAVPGGFAVPLLLLGLLAVGRAREGRPLPGYVGWALLAWAAFGAYVTFPLFGFFLVFVPAALFLLAAREARLAS
ncbi:hypothetical protein D5H75_24900 [Bailinhaonella thermotolerans]|uniref:Uncharacterized protein n=1 Tax=Bailinhaonella thermotolerans TaxID=1070861 RepID=A0A3A4AKL2_9ACTN|nr:hypothetical protein D5H75_24900 [Bailinhaonella thermotolerans]